MKQRLVPILLAGLLVLAFALCLPDRVWSAEATAARVQFVYVLRVAPAFHDEKAWTDREKAAVGQHFARLVRATAQGQVILAGKSSEALDRTFGIVIFEADNEPAAREFMLSDPAVVAGLMSATLHPYAVALLRKP